MDLILTILNFAVLSTCSLYLEYTLLSTLFEPRSRQLIFIWWAYLISDNLIDGYLGYLVEYGGVGFDVASTRSLWASVSALLALCVACSAWKGDVVEVGVCTVLADLFVGVSGLLSTFVANYLMGLDLSTGYMRPIGVHTALNLCLLIAVFMVIRVPVAAIMRTAARSVGRHRLLWAIVGILLIATFSSVSLGVVLQLDLWRGVMVLVELVAVVAFASMLLRKSRDMARRGRLLLQCLETANAYELQVGERLSSLERDLAALEGHDGALERLRASEAGRLGGRVAELQEAYERLRTGGYCDRPALDAVLSSSAERLRGLGVRPEFSVAGVPAGRPVNTMLAMSLLNLACGAAARQGSTVARDAEVALRVRGRGGGVLYRLDVPAAWGRLWAKRSLACLPDYESLLVQERVRGGRSVVLAMDGVGK